MYSERTARPSGRVTAAGTATAAPTHRRPDARSSPAAAAAAGASAWPGSARHGHVLAAPGDDRAAEPDQRHREAVRVHLGGQRHRAGRVRQQPVRRPALRHGVLRPAAAGLVAVLPPAATRR